MDRICHGLRVWLEHTWAKRGLRETSGRTQATSTYQAEDYPRLGARCPSGQECHKANEKWEEEREESGRGPQQRPKERQSCGRAKTERTDVILITGKVQGLHLPSISRVLSHLGCYERLAQLEIIIALYRTTRLNSTTPQNEIIK